MNKRMGSIAIILMFWLQAGFAAEVTVKLGTLAPQGSPWHDILKEMGDKWKTLSGGRVEVKIFAGGVAGDEPDMVRKMRIGQLHAAAVTSVGLGNIDKSTQALHIPLALASYEELDYVRDHLSARLEAALKERGFMVLNWGDAGWVHFFVQKPTAKVSDLKTMKLFVWAGDPASVDLWKDTGFKPVPLATTDALQALQTGMITAFDVTPLAALSMQWFAFTKYMIDLKWAPLTGATIISMKTWEKIPADLHAAFLEAAHEAGKQLRGEIRRLEKEAIDAMVKRGLQVVAVPPASEKEWRDLTEKVYPRIRGEMIPPEYFDEVLKLRDEYRKASEAKNHEDAKVVVKD